uniref:Phosphodiesterase n=1 Tax=Theileria annulata TaxID=5874 RepID=A0A3B0MFV0_THEAN
MEKDHVSKCISEIENYLKQTNANENVINSFNTLKNIIINSKLNLSVVKLLLSKLNNSSPSLQAVNTSIFKPESSPKETMTPENRGWTIGKSRRRNKLSNENEYIKQIGLNWHLDLLELSNYPTVLEAGPIVVVGKHLLQRVGDLIHPNFNSNLLPILQNLQQHYLANPYHNALHAATVGHMSKLLSNIVTTKRKLDPYEEFAFIISSLGHDVGHPGKTNNYLSNTNNVLSMIYNDSSTLENYHCSLLFYIMRNNSSFYGLIPKHVWSSLRKRIIQLILSTDMANHFLHIDNVKEKRMAGTFDIKNDDDYWLLLVLCIKAADIGHNFLPWVDHLPWTQVLFEEFYKQGDEEKMQSIPPLLFFDRNESNNIPNLQLEFFNTMTQPLLNELNYFDESNFINEILSKNSNDNSNNWKKYDNKTIHEILTELENNNVNHEIPDAFINTS